MSSTDRISRCLAGAVISLALVSSACASGRTAPTDRNTGERVTRYTLTSVELMGAGSQNVYEAIQNLRPDFLRTRGTSTMTTVNTGGTSRGSGAAAQPEPGTGTALPIARSPLRVYENEVMLSSPDDLKKIDVKNVIEVRFVPGPEAGVRYGTNHSGGVIFVKTR